MDSKSHAMALRQRKQAHYHPKKWADKHNEISPRQLPTAQMSAGVAAQEVSPSLWLVETYFNMASLSTLTRFGV